MGAVGGLIPSPLHLIALSQVALDRWGRALVILTCPPLVIDGALLILTAVFFKFVPLNIAHYIGYAGGVVLIGFACVSLFERHRKTDEEIRTSAELAYAAVAVAALAELTAPGTWVYWLTIAGPILAEGKQSGYVAVAPFFAGGLVSYYGAAILSVWLISLGTKLHRSFTGHLFLVANVLLLGLGISYLVRAWFS